MIHSLKLFDLVAGYLPPAMILLVLSVLSSGIVRPALIGFVRMSLQLLLVGIYLEFLFSMDHGVLNFLWVVVMVIAASVTAVRRGEGDTARDYLIALIAVGIAALLSGFYYLLILSGDGRMLSARLLIPVMGMLLGNSMTATIIALREFRGFLQKEKGRHEYYLLCGASDREAASPFLKRFIESALSPGVASASNMGLVSLPGMMTGQILGGGNPMTAVHYQIAIVLGIFTITALSVIIVLILNFSFSLNESNVSELR